MLPVTPATRQRSNLDIETSATATSTAAPVPETATSVTFAVHLDQPVSAISPTSFVLATTGTAFGTITAVSGSGENYTVTATGLGGEGTVALALSAYTPTDAAGNQVVLTSSIGHYRARHGHAHHHLGVDRPVQHPRWRR